MTIFFFCLKLSSKIRKVVLPTRYTYIIMHKHVHDNLVFKKIKITHQSNCIGRRARFVSIVILMLLYVSLSLAFISLYLCLLQPLYCSQLLPYRCGDFAIFSSDKCKSLYSFLDKSESLVRP